MQEHLLCPLDTRPLWSAVRLREEDVLHWLFQVRDVGNEAVADGRELKVGYQGMRVVVAGEGCSVQHAGPELPSLPCCSSGRHGSDSVHVVFDGGCIGERLSGGGEGD